MAGLALALPGCPLSDKYFVDPLLGGSSGTGGGSGGREGPSPPGGKSGDGAGRDGKGGRGMMTEMGGRPGVSGASSNMAGSLATAGSGAASGSGATGGTDGTGGMGALGGTGGDAGAGQVCEGTTEVCDGVDNDCDDDIDEDGVCPTDCTARVYGVHTYLLCLPPADLRVQHYFATINCDGFTEVAGVALPPSMELVRVESKEENDFLKRWLREATTESGLIWNGASDVREETIWVWGRGLDVEVQFFTGNGSGGMPYMGAFSDFAPGEPHGGADDGIDCGAFDSSVDWRWIDADCLLEPMGYICESEE